MHIAILGLILGWLLSAALMIKVNFFFAWLGVTLVGVALELVRARRNSKLDESIAYWMMLGAMGPIYRFVFATF